MAILPKPRRQRSSAHEHQAARGKSAPSLSLDFGIEGQSSTLVLHPGGVRHQVIGELQQTVLELDPTDTHSDAEFISRNSPDYHANLQHARDVVDTVNTARSQAMSHGDGLVSVMTAKDTLEVRDPERHQQFKFLSATPGCNMQSTRAIGLSGVDSMLSVLRSKVLLKTVHAQTRDAVMRLKKDCAPVEVSKNVEHFTKLLIYCLASAQREAELSRYPKARFDFMLRSDFHSIYLKLLTSDERQLVKKLLLPAPGETEGVLLKSIGRTGS